DNLYETIKRYNIDVILDDRDERPGVKFKDADLIGIPLRITISQKLLPDKVELYIRKTKSKEIVSLNGIIEKIQNSIVYLKRF
ncbi:MAG: His/Gly/Thr/Pro-type tRNA ligase C-terminal domain-containing protein, partial [Endomicrobia bacterium]|nr:His/Gly/Thr/Pro-type tRNA ligase C-terminal domain-containing protein [Endomicrobiia bacterium]